VEITEHIDALRLQGDLLVAAATRSGLDASVPPCSPWQVKDLLRHTGYIHRWAARHIAECPDTVLDGPPEADILGGGPPDPDLLAWFCAGHSALVETLSTADPGLVCATFMDAPSPLAFWARRQAHETAIHRADAESASGVRPKYEPDFAADGIDELIMGFGQRRKYRPSADGDASMQVRATDTGHAWYVGAEDGRLQARREDGGRLQARREDGGRLQAGQEDGGGLQADREDGGLDPASPAACTVTGPASGLYLFLWHRSDAAQAGVTISGDAGVLDVWQSSVRVRWS
jgi:uncharacterized protein (TIGR03083 family)